ncbi:MAG: DUF1957 domain-containing protein [Candidatus Lindowbacteria bacterium]|nr:DUF1957 domain-containing protein [Candidatus Lindowbacteria bacterium]
MHVNWSNGEAKDFWGVIHSVEKNMESMVIAYSGMNHKKRMADILRQAARELLLMQSSDWLFMLTTGNTPNIARIQIERHWDYFEKLNELAKRYCLDGEMLEDIPSLFDRITKEDCIFPKLSMEHWRSSP